MESVKLTHILLVLGIGFILSSCKQERKSITVETTDITESIYSSVTVEPDYLYAVYSELPGKIIRFDKETGDSVAFGDVICTIDAVGAIKSSENAALNLQLIQNQLSGEANVIDDLNEEIQVARQQYSIDSLQLYRIKTLREKGLSSDSEYEQTKLRMIASKTRLEGLIARKKRQSRELKIQQQQAKNAYESALSTSSNATIKSVVDGLIYEVYKENGELVNAQQPIAMIGSKNEFIIKMLIDEADIIQVAKGQDVLVDLEAYPDETFLAKVDQIYPKMDPKTQTFEVIATFVQNPPKLYLGLTGEANIIINKAKDKIVIPREYLINGSYVITKEGKKNVKTGLKNLTSIEITEGLRSGEKIYLPEE